jgi:hypothetical protein
MMDKGTKEKTDVQRITWLTRTAVLLALTLALQMMGLPQPFTGPAVNAMLLISGIFVGATSGILIGLLTPWIAFMRGILPPPLGPMIPFIMLGNGVLVALFTWIRRLTADRGKIVGSVVGLLLGALGKFLILSSAVKFVVEVPPKIAQAMQIPQLITALTGGVVALVVEGILNAALNTGKDKAKE